MEQGNIGAVAPSANQRSVYLDALRAVALIRVVTYHASGKWWVTVATAMPLMFFIAGSLFAGSVDRRATSSVVRDRFRRILLPYWAYLAVMLVLWGALGVLGQITPANWMGFALPLLSLHGPTGPGSGTALQLTWIALWYLQLHLLFSLTGGVLRSALRQAPVLVWAMVFTGFFAGLALGVDVANGVFFLGCWLLGYHHHDGIVQPLIARYWKWLCLATGPIGVALFLRLHEQSVASSVATALLGLFWLSLALGIQPLVEPYLTGQKTNSVVTWFARRSLTIYLWHMAALYVVAELAVPGHDTAIGRLVWAVALTVAVVPIVGWVEDVAAHRPPELWPGRRPKALSGANRIYPSNTSELSLSTPVAEHGDVVDLRESGSLSDSAPLAAESDGTASAEVHQKAELPQKIVDITGNDLSNQSPWGDEHT